MKPIALIMDDVKFQKGRMVKDPREMTVAEKVEWEKQISANTRQYLFSIGQPLVYKRKDGHVVAEHKDGRITIVK